MPESKAVEMMFSRISGRYDVANHLLSGGIDRYWRYRLVRAVKAHQPEVVADLATGSGDVAFSLRKKLPEETPVYGFDFCEPMLAEARDKQAARHWLKGHLSFDFGDCLDLPMPSDSVDAVTIAFGLRNLEDRNAGLKEMRRVLKPESGVLHVLEFTQPAPVLKPFYRFYLRYFLPTLAKWTTGNRDAYEYLVGSINGFPSKADLSKEIRDAGFHSVKATGLTGSIVALHQAVA